MLFPITTIVLLGCIGWTFRFDSRRSGLRMALSVWIFGLVLTAIPLLRYDVGYSVKVDAFVAVCLLATTGGYTAVRRPQAQGQGGYEDRGKERLVYLWVSGLGIIGALFLLIDAQALGTELSISYLVNNLGAIRAAVFDPTRNAPHTPLFFPGFLLMSCSYVGVIASAKLGRAGGQLLRSMGIANFVLIGAVSLFVFAGRTILVNVALLLLAGAWLSGRKLNVVRPRTLIVVLLVMVSGWYFSTEFISTREGTVRVDYLLSVLERARLSPWVAPLAHDNQAVGTALVNYGYFSSPLPTLTWYLESGPLPGPYWGANSYPLPLQAVNKVMPVAVWADVREETFTPLEAAGYEGNVWGTWLRDLLVDFGYVGTVLFSVLFGAFMAWARNMRERTDAVHYHVLEVLACVTLAFGVFQNLLYVNIYSGSFFVAMAVMLAVRLHLRQSRPAVLHARQFAHATRPKQR